MNGVKIRGGTGNLPPIPIFHMKDGEIAIIRKWKGISGTLGKVVQRYGESLYVIGKAYGDGWSYWFKNNLEEDKEYLVQILPKGTLLEIL